MSTSFLPGRTEESRTRYVLALGIGLPALAIFFGSAMASVAYVKSFASTPKPASVTIVHHG